MAEEIINKVANSALQEFNLEDYYLQGKRSVVDIKNQLFQELILREKDFREYIKATDWSVYQNHYVAVTCSADAIVPKWAFILLACELQPYAKQVVFGTLEDLETANYQIELAKLDYTQYQDKPVIIKGCSKYPVPTAAYIIATNYLRPFAKSIMYGEACSTVPLFKRKK
jgi:hypothetical protein